ncbi:radical SAM protein [Streptomyces sp. NPDC007808]|uniref:radical SAM protein n=1 Tax=Streptomyces sp. NPDC007808 TaxID=3364779 RepID=UPI0036A49F5B
MHQLIAAPFQNKRIILHPRSSKTLTVPPPKYEELTHSVAEHDRLPDWLIRGANRAWDLVLPAEAAHKTIVVRVAGPYEITRATWEINLGCDYDCKMCFLGKKKFAGLDWEGKKRLLRVMRDAGVIWLQITGGEPLIDPDFQAAYALAYSLGMQLEILSNGSQLRRPRIHTLLTNLPPSKLTLSVYGASAATYDGLTRRRGAYARFRAGLYGVLDAGLNVDLSLIITNDNAHEVDEMRAWARELGLPYREYANISPTYSGGAETLPSQSPQHLTQRAPFTGCPAGHTFFHADPHGRASICKIGREPHVNLMTEGVEGLRALAGIADQLMLRTGGCSGCQLSGTCRVCRPMAKIFQEAKAPLHSYCQHGQKETVS